MTYHIYPDIGIRLTSEHIGKRVVRTYPWQNEYGAFSYDGFLSFNGECHTKLVSVTQKKVKVTAFSGGVLELPNDGHWLLESEYYTRIKGAVCEIFRIEKDHDHFEGFEALVDLAI